MKPHGNRMRASLTIMMLLASAGRAFSGPHCPSMRGGRARFRTIARVNTTCRTDANGLVGHQEAYVLGGERLRQITHARGVTIDTTNVVEVELPGPAAYRSNLR